MSAEVEVPLADGQVRRLTKAMVLSAAQSPAAEAVEDDDTRVLVQVEARPYDALALVSLALNEPLDQIRPLAALAALAKLDLRPSGFDGSSQNRTAQQPTYEEEEPELVADEGRLDQASPALNRMLQRKRGKWVALQGEEIVADDPSLNELLEMVQDRDVTVLYVPSKNA